MTTNETILLNLNKKIEELEKSNKKAMEALVPSWCVIDHDLGMIDGIRFAIKEIEANMRDCDNCKHHTENGCESWECAFEPQESEVEECR